MGRESSISKPSASKRSLGYLLAVFAALTLLGFVLRVLTH